MSAHLKERRTGIFSYLILAQIVTNLNPTVNASGHFSDVRVNENTHQETGERER